MPPGRIATYLKGCGKNYTERNQLKEALKQQCVEQKPCVSEIKEDAPHVHKEHKHYSLLSCEIISYTLMTYEKLLSSQKVNTW